MTRFERWSMSLASAATVLTGLGYFWTKYLVQSSEPWAVANHPLQPWFLRAHVLVAPVLVFAIGLITMRHVLRHLREGNEVGRRTGIVAGLMVVPMVVTGYLVQVLMGEHSLRWTALVHIATGVVYALALVAHQALVRRVAAREEAARPDGSDGAAA